MEEQQTPSILSIATKYGLIQGVLSFVLFLVQTLAGITQTWVTTVVGIAILVVLMVLAHREFARTHNRMMTYGQGLGSGTLLATVGAVVSCVLVFVYVKFINTGYFAAAMKLQRAALEQRGITGAQQQQAMAITGMIMNPVGLVVYSLIAGVIVGFIVALIVSIFTQRGDPKIVR
jgi:Protein of unknown function (DUF4199)